MSDLSLKYIRQIAIPEVGTEGQTRLQKSRVLIVGAGGLGIPAALYLASSGVGTIGLVDDDLIEESNLGRQILYSLSDLGLKKVHVLHSKLSILHDSVEFVSYDMKFSKENHMRLAQKYDLIVNASDNFTTRLAINEAAHALQLPWIDAAVWQFEGHISYYLPNNGCYVCHFPNVREDDSMCLRSCAHAGILAPLCGLFGSWAALYTINILLGLHGKENIFHYYDAKTNIFQELKWRKKENCLVCGNNTNLSLRDALSSSQNNTLLRHEKSANNLQISKTKFQQLIQKKQKIVFVNLTCAHFTEKNIFNQLNLKNDLNDGSFFSVINLSLADFFSDNLNDPKFINILHNKQSIYICFCEGGIKSRMAAEVLVRENLNAYFYML